MSKPKSVSWHRLDTAAKIFPPTSNKKDTKVYRFACRLYEEINPNSLQLALDKTMIDFNLYTSIIKKGLFWYYFETSNIKPIVKLEYAPPCNDLYNENTKNLLFQVTYFKKNINVETFHALTDGVGNLQFIRTLVFNYLIIEHSDKFKDNIPYMDYDASLTQKQEDSFQKYFSKEGNETKKRSYKRAFNFKGDRLENNSLQVINGVLSVKDILKESSKYNTTLTIFLTAILIQTIGKELSITEKKNPVVISIPVNLRSYFESASARNFFSVINVHYYFGEEEPLLEDIIDYLQKFLKKELTVDKFRSRINKFISLEQGYLIRAIPLVLKNAIFRRAHHMTNRKITMPVSNIGKITMPVELENYIDLFDIYVSTNKTSLCICSYKDKLSLSFTSRFISTETQKNFFRELTSRGISVSIATNISE